jgi:hypothetical protein
MVSYGLPHLTDIDEDYIVSRVITMVGTGDLNYRSYYWGGIHFYLLFVIFSAYYLIFHAKYIPFEQFASIPVENFYQVARLFNVLLSLIVIYLTYSIGKKLYNQKTGLIASLFLGVGTYYYITAAMVRLDILVMIFVLLAFIYIYKITSEATVNNYVKAAVFTGLATGTKYYGLLMLFPMIYAHLTAKKSKKRKNSYLFLSFAIIIIIFILTNLFPILNWDSFMKDLSIHVSTAAAPHWSTSEIPSISKYGGMFLYNIGIIGTLVFIVAILYFFVRPSKKESLLLIYPLAHFMLAIKSNMVYPRYMIVITPLLWIFLAKSIVEFFSSRPKSTLNKYCFRALVTIILLLPSIRTLDVFISTFKPVTSNLAYEWINNNIQPGMGIWYESYTVRPDSKNYKIYRFTNIKRLNISALRNPSNSCQYLIIREHGNWPNIRKDLISSTKVEKTFTSVKNKIAGPNIIILKIEPNPSKKISNPLRKAFSPENFPIVINIGNINEDEIYLSSGWSKAFYGPKRGTYRWIRSLPAPFYFKLSSSFKNIEAIKIHLTLFADETDQNNIVLKIKVNSAFDKKIILKNGLNEYSINLPKEQLRYGNDKLNSLEFRATYETGQTFVSNDNRETRGPQIRMHKIIFSM